jgi:hypothetical protein
MVVGDTKTIPMAMRIDATARSMTRNGSSSTTPIWNAVVSSDTTNAGIAMRIGHVFRRLRLRRVRRLVEELEVGLAGLPEHEGSQGGEAAASSAAASPSVPAWYGASASL